MKYVLLCMCLACTACASNTITPKPDERHKISINKTIPPEIEQGGL